MSLWFYIAFSRYDTVMHFRNTSGNFWGLDETVKLVSPLCGNSVCAFEPLDLDQHSSATE